MSHLVDEGEYVVELALEVHQYHGMHAEAAGGIRAAALAGRLVHVYPTLGKAFVHQGQVVFAHGLERLQYDVAGFLVGEREVAFVHDGHVQIRELQLVNAEHFLAQGNVAVHGGHVAMHGFDEVGVHLGGNLVARKRRFQRGIVAARVGEELQLLVLRSQRCGKGVAELVIGGVQAFVGGFTQRAVGRHHQRDVAAVRYRVLVALCVGCVGEGEVGVVQQAEDVVGLVGHVACGGQQLLFGGGEHVCAALEDNVQAAAVHLKAGLGGIERLHLVLGKREQLGSEPGAGAGKGNPQRHNLAGVILIARLPGVLVAFALGVVHQFGKGQVGLAVQLQVGQQVGGGLADLSLVGGELRRKLLCCLQRGFERCIVGEDAGKVPAVLLFYLVAGFVCGCHVRAPWVHGREGKFAKGIFRKQWYGN